MWFLSIAALLLLCRSTAAQSNATVLNYFVAPSQAWTVSTGSRVETEVVLSPTKDFLVVAGNDCSMTAINLDGTQKWKYTSTATSEDCNGGILFGTSADGMEYAARAVPNVGGLDSQIVAVSLVDGTSIVYSIGPVPGIVAGTPRITADQQHLIVSSNTDNLSRGHFTVWNVPSGVSIFQFSAATGNSTEPLPFSPIGFQHNPIQGYYIGGFENQNDIFVWGIDNELSDPSSGLGQLYAFQLPINETAPLDVALVGNSRSFQTPTEPVLANDGLSMYWTVTRNELRCWVGDVSQGRNSFDKRPTTIDTIPNDNPRANTGSAPPVVTSSAVYGPMAGSQIFRVDLSCDEDQLQIVNTAASVNSKLLPSSDEMFVFYATIEPDSKLYMLNAETMEQLWDYQLNRGVDADMVISPDGTTVYVVSTGGVLEAVQVAEIVAIPTEAPTLMPTLSPTVTPKPSVSPKPTTFGTEAPTTAPVIVIPPVTSSAPVTGSPIMGEPTTGDGKVTSSAAASTILIALAIQAVALL